MRHTLQFLAIALALLLIPAAATRTQAATPILYKYRITLRDKRYNDHTLRHPERFLSPRSLERRRRQGIRLDATDLPVSRTYVDQIRARGVRICHTSKWNNTVLVATADTTLIDQVRALPFVTATRRVATYAAPQQRDGSNRHDQLRRADSPGADIPVPAAAEAVSPLRRLLTMLHPGASDGPVDSIAIAEAMLSGYISMSAAGGSDSDDTASADTDSIYGLAGPQARQLHVDALHRSGCQGQGMVIAVIDGGFRNADIHPLLSRTLVYGTHDFVGPDSANVYEEQEHGLMVLSCMGANIPGQFVGTAPQAGYWLLRSEDGYSEQMVEEDNWAAAAEYADSVGADLINTSLGYSDFDNSADRIRYDELDGLTRLCSRAASMLADKGIVLCNSAGNSGDEPWKLITAPADARHALTVGALDAAGTNTNFSSLGPSADHRVKPDVMALGSDATVLSPDGTITQASGTSFASPIMCGAVACYWQAHPQLTAHQVVQAIRRLGNNAPHPDNVYGYGLPDLSR